MEVHSVLYGGRGKDREEICELVKEAYEGGASESGCAFGRVAGVKRADWSPFAAFENPVTVAKGRQQIADVFCLLGLVPGSLWSELGDICESPSYGAFVPPSSSASDC